MTINVTRSPRTGTNTNPKQEKDGLNKGNQGHRPIFIQTLAPHLQWVMGVCKTTQR
jgi:hypothetical protein